MANTERKRYVFFFSLTRSSRRQRQYHLLDRRHSYAEPFSLNPFIRILEKVLFGFSCGAVAIASSYSKTPISQAQCSVWNRWPKIDK